MWLGSFHHIDNILSVSYGTCYRLIIATHTRTYVSSARWNTACAACRTISRTYEPSLFATVINDEISPEHIRQDLVVHQNLPPTYNSRPISPIHSQFNLANKCFLLPFARFRSRVTSRISFYNSFFPQQ